MRERAKKIDIEHDIINYLEQSPLQILFTYELSDAKPVELRNRGGNWRDDKGANINGGPYKLIFLLDRELNVLSEEQKLLHLPFVKYESYFIKNNMRNYLAGLYSTEYDLNVVHSTDDLFEVFELLESFSREDKAAVYKLLKATTSLELL